MVFESVVIELLNRYLKPYVKRLDTSQLKVGVWKGHAQLDNLELKEDLFAEADLDVPIKIKRSYIGKLELKIPWKKLTKDPLVVSIDDVYVVLEPDLDMHYDPEKALKRQRKEKEKKIKDYEEAAKKKKLKEKESKKKKDKKEKDSEKPDTFLEKLIVHLTKNMQVKVRDIHVRYEDGVTNPDTLLAAGITLHSLELKSTDSNWAPCVVREAATLIYKLVELNCLGIYFNTCARSLASDDISMDDMIRGMREAIARPAVDPPPANMYLLSPMSALAKVKMNVRTEVDLSLPQLVMGVECEDIVFSLQKKQFKSLLSTVEAFDKHSVSQKFLKYKPSTSLSSSSKSRREWWKYAINAVREEDVKRRLQMWSWTHIKQHRERCRQYQHKYREKLHSLNPSNTLLAEIQSLEDCLDWFNIVLCRKASKKEKKGSKRVHSTSAFPEKQAVTSSADNGRKKVEDKGSSKREKERQKKEEKEERERQKREEKERLKREETQEKLRKKEEKQRKKEAEGGKKKGFFSKLKHRLKQPGHHGDSGEGSRLNGSQKADEDEFLFVRGEVKKKEEEGATGGAVGGAIGGASVTTEAEVEDGDDSDKESEEDERAMRELYEAIGYAEGEVYEFPREYIAHEISVDLKTVTLELIGEKELGKVITKAINLNVLNRPSSKSVSVNASVGSLSMTGVPKPGGCQTMMLSSNVPTVGKEAKPLVDVQLEMHPLNKPWMDVAVKAALQPMQITYDFETVDGLIAMFKPPDYIHFQELTQAASASWDQLKLQTTAGLQDAFKSRKHFEIDVTLHSPYLVVPENGSYSSKDSHLLVVDLGKLSLKGSTKDPRSLEEVAQAVEKQNQDLLYDTFNIKLQGMQVLAATPKDDWVSAMKKESSPLHILKPTGLEIQLFKSIVKDDAYLPSARVEGTLPRFEIKLSDHQLSTVMKVASSLEKPPALIHRTTMYNELPNRVVGRLNSVAQFAEADILSVTSSLSAFDDGEPGSPFSPISPSPPTSVSPTDDKETARFVFTDASIKITVQEIALKLTKVETDKKKNRVEQPILDVIIGCMKADIVDRKWDTQGSVSMKEVAILDYITTENGKPTYLLRTESLDDGNFISLRFVTITQLGKDFAAKYTGLEDSLSAQVSLIKLKLHQKSLTGLLRYGMALVPAIKSKDDHGMDEIDTLETIPESTLIPQEVNLADFQGEAAPPKELGFEVKFAGIDTVLVQDDHDILHSGIEGFFLKGKVEPKKVSINTSIKDLNVKDPMPNAKAPVIVTKMEKHKDIMQLDVVQYNYRPHERDPHDLSWVDTSIDAVLNRIYVKLSASFLANVLEFVQKLDINQAVLQTAAKATADTATATAVAIEGTIKTAHRVGMKFTMHAPLIYLPFSTKLSAGGIIIDLGDFRLSNTFKHGFEVQNKGVSRLSTLDTISMRGATTILDCMELNITKIQIYRKSHAPTGDLKQIAGDGMCDVDTQSTILEPLTFSVQVIRNISQPTEAFPNVDVQLQLNHVKFHLHEEDVHAFISMGMIVAAALVPVTADAKKPKPRSATLLGRPKAGSTISTRSRARTRTATMRSRTLRTPTRDLDVTDVRIKASVKDVSLELTTVKEPLLKASASGLNTEVNVEKNRVIVSSSVDSLSVIDLKKTDTFGNTKIVSLAENTSKVSTIFLTINLNHEMNPKDPLGQVKANIAQVQLLVPVPFVLRALDFVQRLDINPNMLKNATIAAQEGATAVTTAVAEAAQDKYFNVDISVQAPVFFLPLNDAMDQAVMVDLGSLEVQNTVLHPDHEHSIDAFGVKLDAFKVSRVLLDLSKSSSPVVAERVLLQPFGLMLAVERNLTPWYTKIPAIFININMGEFKIYLGQDDLEEFAKFGADVGAKITTALQTMDFKHFMKAPDEPQDQVVEVEKSLLEMVEEMEDSEVYDKLRILSSLAQFQIKIFKGEPKLDVSNPKSFDLNQLDDYGLASLQLITMTMNVTMSSNEDVQVQATMRDIALCDEQKESLKKKTGNRVMQHYTSNPIQAYTGMVEQPIVSITYMLRGDQHIVLLKAEKLLLLSDVAFLSTNVNYFKSIAELAMPPKPEPPSDFEETLTAGTATLLASTASTELEPVKKEVAKAKKPLPRLKVEANIKEFRVAIIEAVDEPQPQALTLKVSTYAHFQLTEDKKQGSVNVVDLSIATSSFFDLDNTTSWVLLPCSMMVALTGPKDKPAMDINVVIDPISLHISPAIVRLIIHATKTLIPEKETEKVMVPRDLWEKKLLHEEESKLWFLSPVPLHKASTVDTVAEKKGEIMTVNIESIEIILESESTSRSPGIPLLALNAMSVIQMFEWTGDLTITGNINCEASYYNESLSIWEPILEPIETKNGRQQLWDVNIDVTKTPVNQLTLDGAKATDPQFCCDVSASAPLQITLSRASLELIKSLADAYAKEYGKQVEGNVKVNTLTGAPFTIVNMLGGEASLFIQPGPSLKFKDVAEYTKLSPGESVDILYKKERRRKSYASLIVKAEKQKSTIDILIGKKFKQIKNIPIDVPGLHYYTLFPKDHTSETYGLVVDVAVTGVKKTVTVRSSIQFKNHLKTAVDILYANPSAEKFSMEPLATIQPNELYSIPIDKAQSYDYYIRRNGLGFKPLGPPILWKSKRDSDYINFKCVMEGDDSIRDFIRVHCKEEKYKQRRDLPAEEYPHFVFHLHPPVVIQNLLPFEIFIDSLNSGYTSRPVKSGEYVPIHEIDLESSPQITVKVVQEREESLNGKFAVSKKPPEYMNFNVQSGKSQVELGVHSEDLGYLKMSIYSPFWMVNKTGLNLEYKEGYTASHPAGKETVLFSTSGSKSKIQLRALTEHGSYTEWTKSFALNAVGTSGSYTAKLGEQQYKFGVEVRLSQFTLTKLVIFTPYYLLVNEADVDLNICEEQMAGWKTRVRRGDLTPFWPLTTANSIVVMVGEQGKKFSSIPLNYKKSDFNVLQFDSGSEVAAVCVEVQESESATVVTFTPYYPGCVPVQIINHFPDMTLQFKQESKSPKAIVHTLAPREVLNYTWDDPEGKKMIRWNFPSAIKINNRKPIEIVKDSQTAFTMKFPQSTTPSADDPTASMSKSIFHVSSQVASEDWLAIDESLSENLVGTPQDDDSEESSLSSGTASLSMTSTIKADSRSPGSYRGYWKSFVDGLQRVLIFTPDEGVIDRIKAENSYSFPLFEASLAIRNIGISLVDNYKKRELAYIAITQSGVIWQIDKGKKVWKNVSNSLNLLLEEAYQGKSVDVKRRNLSVNLETMEMFEPIKGKLRRTHYDGVFLKFAMSEKDFSVQAKIGYVQIDNQLPFSVYPQVLYPVPPPPTVASATEPKPFVEASVILRRGHDQSTVTHFKYVHVLIQKMAVNVDLGFILSLVDFFSLDEEDLQLEAERVKSDVKYLQKSLKDTIVPELADDFKISRSFFDVLHLAPIKITLSFNIRSFGKNKSDDEITVGDRFLQLFLHSIGVILTSVQETEMKFSFFHLEYQPTTGRGLTNLLAKHYRNQALFQLHTIIFGLDALGNPVSVVKGVVGGAVDLFYEPIKGSVLGPEEFFEGLGIGLRSFFAAGVLGGITGAGARITGTVGDVFAKLTFDEEFIDKRQQQKSRPPRLGSRLGGFAKNLFEGVTGVVTQPVKGLQKEGAVGLLKGTGKGLVGLLVRPTGGLVDLASGTLSFVSRKTQVGNIEVTDIRPPRFIGRDGIVAPYSPTKAVGNALLVNVDEGKFVDSDFYFSHIEVNNKPLQFVLVTDRRLLLIEQRVLGEGWKSEKSAVFQNFSGPVEVKDINVVMRYRPETKGNKLPYLTLRNVQQAREVAEVINEGYVQFLDEL